MPRIQKLSARMLIMLNGLIIIVPLCTLLLWIFNQWDAWAPIFSKSMIVDTPEGVINMGAINLTTEQRILGLCGSFTGLLPLLIGAFFLKNLFQNYKLGHIFTVKNTDTYKKLGYLFFLHAFITQPLCDTLMILAATFSNAPGHRYLTVGFGTPNLETIFCGVLVLIISWVMAEAQKLQDDQQFII